MMCYGGVLLSLLLVLSSCGEAEPGGSTVGPAASTTSTLPADDQTCPDYPRSGFVVEGTVHNPGATQIPPSVGVHVVWLVSSGSPDYGYAFGEGCYDADAAAYVVALPTAPPERALNDWGTCRVGVATVHLHDGDLPEGSDPYALIQANSERWYGATDRFAIVFTSGDCGESGWPGDFSPGYGLGSCASAPPDFDLFQATDPGATDATLEVSHDPDSLHWCNWT